MKTTDHFLARKYALAFLHVLAKKPSEKELETIDTLRQFLCDHKKFIAALTASSAPFKEKKRVITHLFDILSLPQEYKMLALLLAKRGRLALLGRIMDQIELQIHKFNNEEVFLITSSHALTPEQQKKLLSLTQKRIPSKPVIIFRTDSALISGVRIQSQEHLWERSMAKSLRNVRLELCSKGIS